MKRSYRQRRPELHDPDFAAVLVVFMGLVVVISLALRGC